MATLVELEPVNTQALLALVARKLGYKKYKQISDIAAEHWKMKYALSSSRKLQRLVEQKKWARDIVETVIALEENVLRESSTYSTLAISDTSNLDVCPIDASKISLLDRFEGDELGLLTIGRQRMDRFVEGALGDFVEKNGAEALNPPLPENDSRAFELLCMDDDRFYNDFLPEDIAEAEKVASIMREHFADEYGELGHLLAKVQPRRIEELIAFYAMHRPGPMQFLDEYLRRRSGEVPVTYETPELEPILKETYGLILYQEQFMQIINVISGLSFGKADCIRRSLGKRKAQQTEMWHGIFFDEARKRGFSDDCIARIWDKLQYHSMYCFPKAHAVARALLLYRVAYVKANLVQA